MKSVTVVGANGYVGSALCAVLERDSRYQLARVTRSNADAMREQAHDIVLNVAMPSKRFWARTHPQEDFIETVQKTADLLYGWRYKKFVQISTVSARCELHTIYGRHKAAAEMICQGKEHLIIRLGSMYSRELPKGVLIDMLQNRKVHVSAQSRYCFAPLSFVASWIAGHLDRTGIVEVGARNTVSLQEIAHQLGGHCDFEGPVECQEIENPEPDFPDAREVFGFLDEMRKVLR